MLMRNFLSAEELKLTEVERDGLIKVLNALERGELVSYEKWKTTKEKNTKPIIMSSWFNYEFPECGTVGCIAGWANIMTGGKAFKHLVFNMYMSDYFRKRPELADLFTSITYAAGDSIDGDKMTEKITKGLTNFLTTGKVIKKTTKIRGYTHREF
jgi:hypothetical protein